MSGPLVCVIAAGRGTRMGFADGELHKALAPLSNRAVLTHVLESFPPDARFVIAVGHRADQLRAYIALAHPDRDVTFVTVDNYDGPGSGPGLSVLTCAEALGEDRAVRAGRRRWHRPHDAAARRRDVDGREPGRRPDLLPDAGDRRRRRRAWPAGADRSVAAGLQRRGVDRRRGDVLRGPATRRRVRRAAGHPGLPGAARRGRARPQRALRLDRRRHDRDLRGRTGRVCRVRHRGPCGDRRHLPAARPRREVVP